MPAAGLGPWASGHNRGDPSERNHMPATSMDQDQSPCVPGAAPGASISMDQAGQAGEWVTCPGTPFGVLQVMRQEDLCWGSSKTCGTVPRSVF